LNRFQQDRRRRKKEWDITHKRQISNADILLHTKVVLVRARVTVLGTVSVNASQIYIFRV
jgi:hypothetical protein